MGEQIINENKAGEHTVNENIMEMHAGSDNKRAIARVGVRYALFGAAVIAVQFLAAGLLRKTVPGWVDENQVLLTFLLTIFGMDVVGFPLVWLLHRKLPAVKLEQSSLGAGKFFMGLLFCAGILGAGMLIGLPFHFALSKLIGVDPNENNEVAMLMLNSRPFMRILTVGILAPIFEELVFRKVLIDHLAKYGKWLAVAASGLMFGLFHGNFSQCFFAAGLGFFFAYIYLKTGKIRYTIAYHMAINLTTSVVTVSLLTNYMAAVEKVGMENLTSGSTEAVMQILPQTLLVLGWVAVLGILAVAGVVLLCLNLKKFRLEDGAGAPTFAKGLAAVVTNPGMWAFFAVCLFLFVESYLP